ncbi:MAG: hypothetical protein Q8891_01740 [Bacteroidota bacterium]|nr:hypothetical protein [Bacteroidota bacterium]
MKFFLISLSVLFLLPNFFNINFEKDPVFNKVEFFDPSLSKINSVQKLIEYADSISEKKYAGNSFEYAKIVARIIRNRFYHGFSSYSLKQNWIAATTQYIFGYNVACPVNSDEILRYPYAGCSQQAIVLVSVMKRQKVPYRSIGFPHHYATELNFNNSWYFFDTDMEPEIHGEERNENNWKQNADSLKKFYNAILFNLDWEFGKSLPLKVGKINSFPAPRAYIFQTLTKYLSRILWIFPLLIVIYPRKNKV